MTFRSIHADLSCKWADFSFSLPILLLCLYFIKHVCLPPQCNDHKTKIEPCRKCTTCAAYKMGLIPMAGETARTQQAERAREKEPWSVCAEKINLYMKVYLARNHWSYLIWRRAVLIWGGARGSQLRNLGCELRQLFGLDSVLRHLFWPVCTFLHACRGLGKTRLTLCAPGPPAWQIKHWRRETV